MRSSEFSPGSSRELTPETYRGRTWRHIPASGEALNLHHILHANGRWNRSGLYGALYLSMSSAGARAEWRKYRDGAIPNVDPPRDLVEIHVAVRPVLDLTDPDVVKALGVPPGLLVSDSEKALDTCHEIADWARSADFAAIRYESAAGAEADNLAIYPDVVRPQNVSLEEVDRQPLNYEP